MSRGYWQFILFEDTLNIAWVTRDGNYGCRLYTLKTIGLDGIDE